MSIIIIKHAQIIVAVLIILLVLVTFYRLIHVWAYTLNFSEVISYYRHISTTIPNMSIVQASIQGPQGWDVVVNWVMEKVSQHRL